MAVPYYDTVNKEQNPQDDMWCTADFSSEFREIITFCAEGAVREDGEIEIRFAGLPGVGSTALLQAIESDMVTLMAQRDPNHKLVLTQRSAPYEVSSGTAKLMYELSVFVDYQLHE